MYPGHIYEWLYFYNPIFHQHFFRHSFKTSCINFANRSCKLVLVIFEKSICEGFFGLDQAGAETQTSKKNTHIGSGGQDEGE